jgi:hypothetical protein
MITSSSLADDAISQSHWSCCRSKLIKRELQEQAVNSSKQALLTGCGQRPLHNQALKGMSCTCAAHTASKPSTLPVYIQCLTARKLQRGSSGQQASMAWQISEASASRAHALCLARQILVRVPAGALHASAHQSTELCITWLQQGACGQKARLRDAVVIRSASLTGSPQDPFWRCQGDTFLPCRPFRTGAPDQDLRTVLGFDSAF